MKRFGLILLTLLALSCGPRGGKKEQQPQARPFPMAEVPSMITDPQERLVWVSAHFWDRFTDTSAFHAGDSTMINGVITEDVEKQMGVFATLLRSIELPVGEKAMTSLYEQIETFQLAHPDGNLFQEMAGLADKYFFDPNSPLRNEDLYLPFVSRMAESPLVPSAEKARYEWDKSTCSINRTGTPAADFTFVDSQGKTRTLYGIKAEYTLLIFGNPDCKACKDLMEDMSASDISALIYSGVLKVADIYIDEEIELWKERIADYPNLWINGYDPNYSIRGERIYAVRAVPSLYLLDKDKKVILKDALPDDVLAALESILEDAVNAF